MEAVFVILALAGYLGFLVDWKELAGVLRQGGWAALAFFALLGICIALVLSAPAGAPAPGMHH